MPETEAIRKTSLALLDTGNQDLDTDIYRLAQALDAALASKSPIRTKHRKILDALLEGKFEEKRIYCEDVETYARHIPTEDKAEFDAMLLAVRQDLNANMRCVSRIRSTRQTSTEIESSIDWRPHREVLIHLISNRAQSSEECLRLLNSETFAAINKRHHLILNACLKQSEDWPGCQAILDSDHFAEASDCYTIRTLNCCLEKADSFLACCEIANDDRFATLKEDYNTVTVNMFLRHARSLKEWRMILKLNLMKNYRPNSATYSLARKSLVDKDFQDIRADLDNADKAAAS